MTKEELEKEATEYAQKLGAKDFLAKPKEIVAYFGYLAGAEPREKRIAELETRCNELFLQTMQLTNAKEIIKELLNLPFASDEEVFADVSTILGKAEQFIKDSEVEK